MRPNFNLMRATLTGALGGLLFGFDTVVISGAIGALVHLYSLTPKQEGFTVAIGLVGTVIGALSAGFIGQKLGSRETLRITAILYIVSAAGCGLAWDWNSFLFFRFVGGLGIGASSVLGPVYIAELAPAKWRGRLVAAFQFNVVFGIVLAYTSNYLIRLMNLGATEWRWQVGIAAIPAVGFLALLFGIPRSPRWSASRERIDESLSVLKMMGDPDPEAELADIRAALAEEHASAHEPVFRWKYRYPLFLAISIGAFNQLAGINAILYYLNPIFQAAGYSQLSGDQKAIAIGLTNLVFTMVGMSFIDMLGRKTLLLIGAAGTATCLAAVAWIFAANAHRELLVWTLITYIAFFSVSQGAVIWVYIGEVFPTHVRSKGQGLGSASHWFMNAAIAMLFPVVAHDMSTAAPFVFFAVMTVVQFFVVLFVYPETKGQTLEALQDRLAPKEDGWVPIESGFWSPGGRIGRGDFWLRSLALAFFAALFRVVLLLAASMLAFVSNSGLLESVLSVASVAVLLYVVWVGIVTEVKRLHDLGRSGWWAAMNLTILGSPLLFLFLGVARGEGGPNRWDVSRNPKS